MRKTLLILACLVSSPASAATVSEQLAAISRELTIPVWVAAGVDVDSDACLQRTITSWYTQLTGDSRYDRDEALRDLRQRLEQLRLRGVVFQGTATTAYLRGRVTRYDYSVGGVSCETDGCIVDSGSKLIDTDAFTAEGAAEWMPVYRRQIMSGVMSIQERAPRVVGTYDVYTLWSQALMWGGQSPSVDRYFRGVSSTQSPDFRDLLDRRSVRRTIHWERVAFQLCDLQGRLSPWHAFDWR